MHDNDDAPAPCWNGCTRKDRDSGELVPLRAGFGVFCGRCYRRAENALALVGPLVEHLLSLVPLGSSAPLDPTGIHGTKAEAAIPGRWKALNDANFAYTIAGRWSWYWADILGIRRPDTRGDAWLDAAGNIVGMRTSVPVNARQVASRVTAGMIHNLGEIFDTKDVEAISAFIDDLQLIDEMRFRWPTEDRPTKDTKTTCPGCLRAGGLLVYPPDYRGQDARVVCKLCDHRLDTTPITGPMRESQQFMPNEYELARLEQAKQARRSEQAEQNRRRRERRDAELMAASVRDEHEAAPEPQK
jgi:hypothetical protein